MSKFNLFLKNNAKVTPENLRLLYDELQMMKGNGYIDKHEEQSKEAIQYIIEYLIYGDKHDSSIFDVFCEYNFMNEFIHLANLNHRSMNLQIIKSFSVLILNLTNTTTLYYIFSNNFINQIVSNDYEKYDDDFLSYYVNFMKSLSLKIDHTTIQFFFHKQFNSFPLLHSALKLYNHTDPMIKNVVRNIILTVMKIRYEPITEYFSSLPSISYFPFLSCRLRDLIIKMNEEIISDDQVSLKNIHDDIVDDILYLQDIFSLKIERINYILTNSLFHYMILPLLCGSLVSMTKPRIAISVSIYVLLALFHYIKDQAFLNVVFSVIFSEKLNKKIMWFMEDYPKNAKNYYFDWNSQKKASGANFTGYITTNFSEPFVKSLIYQVTTPYPEISALIKKYDKLSEEMSINSPQFVKTLIEDVLAKFSNSEFDIMTTYHKNLSIATGVNVGLSEGKGECFLKVLEKLLSDELKEVHSNEDEGVKKNLSADHSKNAFLRNECRENLYSYLRSKDDTLILLVSLLIYTIHRKNVSKELLSKAKLMKANEFARSDYDTNRILNEIFSIDFSGNSETNKSNEGASEITNENTIKLRFSKNETGMLKIGGNITESLDINGGNAQNKDINTNGINNTNSLENNPFDSPDVDKNSNNNYFSAKTDQIFYEVESQDGNITTTSNKVESIPFFDNVYFTNLLASKSNEVQNIYDSELVDNLLNLLMVEPPFRTITNRIILENISTLLIKNEGFSFVERSQLDILNKIYYSYLSNIKLIILNNKYIRETGFELFETEWKNYKFEILQTVEELVSKPFLLIPFNLEDIIEDYPKILRIQKTEVDGFKSNLIIFMTIHDLRCKIYKDSDFIRPNFPLKLGGFNLDLEQSYNLTNIGLEIYPCKMRFSTAKSFLNYILLIYQNHLYFALPDVKDYSFALIKYKYALRHLESQFDRSDPRILNIIVKDKNNYLDIAMYFEDVSKTSTVKKSLEEQRKSSRNTEYLLLDSYFDDLISKWKF